MYKKIWKTNEWLTAGVDTIARHIFTISLAWALLCLRNLNAVFMQSGPFVVLNSLQLAGCAFNDVRWRTMIADASLRIIISEPQTVFTTGCSLPGVLPFSVCFLFFIYRICFPFFSSLLFFLDVGCCLSRTAAAVTCCETNSLEYGWKFPIAKTMLLTLTQAWKQTKDESCRW